MPPDHTSVGQWRVQHFDTRGRIIHGTISFGGVSDLVRRTTLREANIRLDMRCDEQDPPIQNAPTLLNPQHRHTTSGTDATEIERQWQAPLSRRAFPGGRRLEKPEGAR